MDEQPEPVPDGDATNYKTPPIDANATVYKPASVDPDATDYSPTTKTARSMAPRRLLPFTFGEYTLLEKIGEGGMGVVYRAGQPVGDGERQVALKMIQGGRLSDPDSIARFLQEARAAAALDHPGIVAILDIGEIDERHYFTMPLVGCHCCIEG